MISLAHAAPAAAEAGTQSTLVSSLPIILMLVVFYFLLIRPQQTREKKRRKMVSELKKGDRVVLTSGIYGRVVKAGETVFVLELGKGLQIEVDANAVAAKVEEAAAAADKKAEENKGE